METTRQKMSRDRNHLVMRLRGASSLFRTFGAANYHGARYCPPYKMSNESDLKARVVAKEISWKIDEILELMGAETEANRIKRLRKEMMEYKAKNL